MNITSIMEQAFRRIDLKVRLFAELEFGHTKYIVEKINLNMENVNSYCTRFNIVRVVWTFGYAQR